MKRVISQSSRWKFSLPLILLMLLLGLLLGQQWVETSRVLPLAGSAPHAEEEGGADEQRRAGRDPHIIEAEDPAGLQRAIEQDAKLPRGVPAATTIYDQKNNSSPLNLNPSRWTALGPKGSDVAGRVEAVASDPVDPRIAYLASYGGVWKTTNCCSSATTWSAITDGFRAAPISAIDVTIDPSNHNTLYVVLGDTLGPGILKSTDQGLSWNLIGTSLTESGWIRKIRVDPRNSNRLVALVAFVSQTIFLSYDGGATWTEPCTIANVGGYDRDGLVLKTSGPATEVFAAIGGDGIHSAVLPSTGCPATWTQVWTAPTNAGRIDLALAPSNGNYFYAQVENADTGGQLGVWRSTDGGSNWQQRSTGSALHLCNGSVDDIRQNYYNQAIAVDPNNQERVFMGTVTLYVSDNGGAGFKDVICAYTGGSVHPDQHALAFVGGSSNSLLVGNDGGIYLSSDADSTAPVFSNLNGSLNTFEFYRGDLTANFALSARPGIVGGSQDNGTRYQIWSKQSVGVATWRYLSPGDGFSAQIEPVLGERWYSSDQSKSIYLQTNFGDFFPAGAAWESEPSLWPFLFKMAKSGCPSTGCTHMIAATNRIWETVTGGMPWGSWYVNSPTFNSIVSALTYAPSISTTAVVGLGNGEVWYGFNLGRGSARSARWFNVTAGQTDLPGTRVSALAVDPSNSLLATVAFTGYDGHLLYQLVCSANCASTAWVNKTGDLPASPLWTLAINPRNPRQVFVSNYIGVYYTDDISVAAPHWVRFAAGLPNVFVADMVVDPGATTLAIFTQSRGAYAWPLIALPATATPTPIATAVSATPTPTLTPAGPTPTATVGPCNISFSDVNSSDYFYTPVLYLACHGIVSGYGDGTFRPFNNTTRSQLAKIVVGAQGWEIDTRGGPHFSDVPSNHPFYSFVETAANRGIISGYSSPGQCVPDSTPCFKPFNNVTRGQLSKIIVLAKDWPIVTPQQPHFSDVPRDNPFYGFIETAFSKAIISGYSDATFRPGSSATRGQISKIVFLATISVGSQK